MQQLPLSIHFPQDYSEENFLISECNRDAWSQILSWVRQPVGISLLKAPPASGKNHLAHIWAERCHGKVMTEDEIESHHDPLAVFENYRSLAVLDIDEADEEDLLHLINATRESEYAYQLLLTFNDDADTGWESIQLPDLRSRLQAMPQAAINPPDESLLAALLLKQMHERQLSFSQAALAYMLPRIERSFSGVFQMIEMIDHYAVSHKRRITRSLIRDWMQQRQGVIDNSE